jgi:sensor domain CHASE-containing protein
MLATAAALKKRWFAVYAVGGMAQRVIVMLLIWIAQIVLNHAVLIAGRYVSHILTDKEDLHV